MRTRPCRRSLAGRGRLPGLASLLRSAPAMRCSRPSSVHGEGGDLMTEAPLREVRRAVYRPVREGNALEDTVARLVQTIRLGRRRAGRVAAARARARRRGTASAATPCARRSASSPTPATSCAGGAATAARSSPIPLPQPPHPGVVPVDELEDVLGLRRVIEAGAARAAAGRTLDPRGARRAVGAARGGVGGGRGATTAGSTRCCT